MQCPGSSGPGQLTQWPWGMGALPAQGTGLAEGTSLASPGHHGQQLVSAGSSALGIGVTCRAEKTSGFHIYIYMYISTHTHIHTHEKHTENVDIYIYIYIQVSILDIIRPEIRIIGALFVNSALHPTIGDHPKVKAGCGAGILPMRLALPR